MVAEFAKLKPHYIHLGTPPEEAPASLEEWLTREIVSVSPEEVRERNHQRNRAIQRILNATRKRKR